MAVYPFPEWRPDDPGIDSGFSANVSGVLPAPNGTWRPLTDVSPYSGALSNKCLGAITVRKNNAANSIYAAVADAIERLDPTDISLWDDVTPAAGFTVTAGEFVQFRRFKSDLIAVTGGNAPQKNDISSGSQFANVGGSPPTAKYGATINERSPVVRIERGRRARVVTDRGSVTADFVVLAGNAYHFVEPRLRGQLFPVNSFIIATKPLSAGQVAEINPRDLAVCDPNFVLEYFRLSADKRLLFGGRFRYFGVEEEKIRRFMPPKMHRVYPQLAHVAIDHAWGGTIGVTANRVPQLGRLADNILYLQGYSGHGVNVTHLAGQIMADTVAGTFERFDIFANIKPVLIPGAHTFRNQMVALGVLYYQIKDKL